MAKIKIKNIEIIGNREGTAASLSVLLRCCKIVTVACHNENDIYDVELVKIETKCNTEKSSSFNNDCKKIYNFLEGDKPKISFNDFKNQFYGILLLISPE